MKNKQKGIITLVAGAISLVAVFGIYYYSVKSSMRIPPSSEIRYTNAELAVDAKVVARLDRYEKGLQNMMQTNDPSAGALDFSAFGDPFGSSGGNQYTDLEGYWDGGFSHVVSMVYVSDTKRFAEIDHMFYSEGDRLSDGVLISAITKDGVTMEQNKAARRVTVGTGLSAEENAEINSLLDEAIGSDPRASGAKLDSPIRKSSGGRQSALSAKLDDAQRKLDAARKKAASIPNNEKLLQQLDIAQKSLDAAREKSGN